MTAFIFISGINGWSGIFEPAQRLLEKDGWRVYGFDHWDDTGGTQWDSIEDMADSVRDMMDAAGIERGVICGESFGGTAAQVFAHRYPERALALVPVVTFAYLPFDAQRNLTDALYSPLMPFAKRVPPGVSRFVRQAFNPALTPGDPDHVRRLVAQAKMPGVATYLSRTRQALAFDARAWLPTLDVPTLVVTGRRDRLIPPACSEEIAALVPDAQLHIIENGGHLAHIAYAEEFVRVFGTFWDSIAKKADPPT